MAKYFTTGSRLLYIIVVFYYIPLKCSIGNYRNTASDSNSLRGVRVMSHTLDPRQTYFLSSLARSLTDTQKDTHTVSLFAIAFIASWYLCVSLSVSIGFPVYDGKL